MVLPELGILSYSIILVVFLGVAILYLGYRHNEAHWGGAGFACLDGLNLLMCRHFHRLKHDPVPLPEKGGCLVVCNHVSGLDPLLMIAATKRPLRFMIAREEYERFGLQWLFRGVGCIPVERKGRPEQALREALRSLNDGEVVALFPHGKIHLDSDPPRKLKGGVAWLAKQAEVPVFPMRLTGISGAGHTLLSVLMRSRARLRVYDKLSCQDIKSAACMELIAECIEGRQDTGEHDVE